MISPREFDDLFNSFTATAFRLETLPAYDVGGAEAERLAAWRAGEPRPVQSVATSPWLARIASTTLRGKSWVRVRVIDDPLTDYQRFQLAHAYPEAQTCGDNIRILRRPTADMGPDFWMFDAPTEHGSAVVMNYDDEGHWLGAERVDEGPNLNKLRAVAFGADKNSRPLNEFLAEMMRA